MYTLAYLDPGAGSLLAQALVGGSAGIFVFARYVWQTYFFSSRDTLPKEGD